MLRSVEVEDVTAEKLEKHAAEGSGHAPHADEGSDRLAGEHVRDGGEEVRRPRLVGSPDQSDQQDGSPVPCGSDRQDRHDKHCVGDQGRLSRSGDAPSATEQVAGKVSTGKADDGDQRVDGHEVGPARLDVEVTCLFEVIGKPEQEEEPNGVGEELGHDEGPGLSKPG